MICLIIVLVLGRLKIVESLKLILAPGLHSVSNRTSHFRVLIPADTSRGLDGINIVSVVYFLELIVRTFLLRGMCSVRAILTLEQQLNVLEELVRDNRVEVNFTLATRMEWKMVLQMVVIHSTIHTLQLTRSLHQACCQCDHHASCSTSSSTS